MAGRKMSEETRRVLQMRRATIQPKPTLRSAGLDGWMAGVDWLEENADLMRRQRGVERFHGMEPLSTEMVVAEMPPDRRSNAQIQLVPQFWRHGPLVRIRDGEMPDQYRERRRKFVEAVYLRWAAPGTAPFLRTRFQHRLAWMASNNKAKDVPTALVNGVYCRVVTCFEREALVVIMANVLGVTDDGQLKTYLASPCIAWPEYVDPHTDSHHAEGTYVAWASDPLAPGAILPVSYGTNRLPGLVDCPVCRGLANHVLARSTGCVCGGQGYVPNVRS